MLSLLADSGIQDLEPYFSKTPGFFAVILIHSAYSASSLETINLWVAVLKCKYLLIGTFLRNSVDANV